MIYVFKKIVKLYRSTLIHDSFVISFDLSSTTFSRSFPDLSNTAEIRQLLRTNQNGATNDVIIEKSR